MKKAIFLTAFSICFISCFKKKPQEVNIDLKMGLLEVDKNFALSPKRMLQATIIKRRMKLSYALSTCRQVFPAEPMQASVQP